MLENERNDESSAGMNSRNLIIVLSLTVAVLLVAAPFLAERSTKSSLQRATMMISSNVHLTRQKALAGESNYRISYDYREQAFRIYREDMPGHWVLDPPENQFLLPQGVILSPTSRPSDGAVSISAAGDVTGGQEVLLNLRDDNDNKVTIRVSRAGHIQEFPSWK